MPTRSIAAIAARSHLSAIQLTTAAGISAVLDLLAEGQLPGKGLVRQEDVPLEVFLANRFGRVYAQAGAAGAGADARAA